MINKYRHYDYYIDQAELNNAGIHSLIYARHVVDNTQVTAYNYLYLYNNGVRYIEKNIYLL